MDALSAPLPRRRPWRFRLAVLLSLLIHVAIGVLLLVTIRREGKPELLPPPAPVTMLFESGKPTGPSVPNPEVQAAPPPSPPIPAEQTPTPSPPQPATPQPALPELAPPQPTAPQPPLPQPAPPEPLSPQPAPPEPAPPEPAAPAPPGLPPQAPPRPEAPAAQPQVAQPAAPEAPAIEPPATRVPAPEATPIPLPAPTPAPAPLPAPAAPQTPLGQPPTAQPPISVPLTPAPPPAAPAKPTPPPPRPPAQPRPAPKPPDFPAPMNYSFGKPFVSPRAAAPPRSSQHVPGTIDMSLGPGAKGLTDPTPFSEHDKQAAGADWRNALSRWVSEHAYYPEQARRELEEGDATVHVVVEANGRVKEVELVGKSGSMWLDLALQALFRDQHIPPLPPGNRDGIDFDFTMHYILIRSR